MHISQLHLYTYTPTQLIDGTLEIAHDGGKVILTLSEADRNAIQQICVNAFIVDRQKIVNQLLADTPALIALEPPASSSDDYAHFEPVETTDDNAPF